MKNVRYAGRLVDGAMRSCSSMPSLLFVGVARRGASSSNNKTRACVLCNAVLTGLEPEPGGIVAKSHL